MPRARSRRCPLCLINHRLDVGKLCPACDSEMRPWADPPDDEDLESELELEYGGLDDEQASWLRKLKRDKREQEALDFQIELQVANFRASLDGATADDFRNDL